MSEPPFDDGRRSRSDAASRLAAMLADTGDDLVLPDDPHAGVERRASTADDDASGDDAPSVAAIAARPAPVQPSSDRPRRSRRSRRPSSDGAEAAVLADASDADPGTTSPSDATQRLDLDDLDVAPEPSDAPERGDASPRDPVGRGGEPDRDGAPDRDGETDGETIDEDTGEVWADWDSLLADGDGDGDGASASDDSDSDDSDSDDSDSDEDDDSDGSDAPAGEPGRARAEAGAPASAAAASASAASDGASTSTSSGTAPAAHAGSSDEPPRLRRVTLRSVAFGTVLALLVAAVPVLAWVGKERLLDSRGGELVAGGTDTDEPGYNALVVPTVNGLVLQRDRDGTITGTTLLALGAGSEGGTVLQVPMNTAVREQKFLFDRLTSVAENSSDELYSREVADLLNVGIPIENVVTIDDESVASLTAPIAPLVIDNPDAVVTDDGEEIPAGTIELGADQIGPYMRARVEGESELARLARTEAIWTAWLAAVGEVGVETGIGQGFTDIGPFLRTLAAGEPVVQTLDVALPDDSDQDDPPYVPADGFHDQILDAVPYPTSPGAGRRWELELYNGADPTVDIPREMMRQLIGQDAALTRLGNATEVGRSDTLIEYSGAQWRDAADRAAFVLGGDTEVRKMSEARAEQAGADVVITFGTETLERDWGEG